MALEAVVFPQDSLAYACKEFFSMGPWSYDLCNEEDKSLHQQGCIRNSDPNSSTETCTVHHYSQEPAPLTTTGRRKRRRSKSSKNKEDIENQRMTHIAVERNRRKQMNEYLAVLRSLMPPSYVQRGDQASIVGGAINFVKELEQFLQSMESVKRNNNQQQPENGLVSSFSDFFCFPQYTTRCSNSATTESMAMADIEVTMVDNHANLKILSKKRPKQLLKMVTGIQNLSLNILHLNVTTVDQMVLYSISAKVEEESEVNTVDEIASAVNQMLRRIQEEEAALI